MNLDEFYSNSEADISVLDNSLDSKYFNKDYINNFNGLVTPKYLRELKQRPCEFNVIQSKDWACHLDRDFQDGLNKLHNSVYEGNSTYRINEVLIRMHGSDQVIARIPKQDINLGIDTLREIYNLQYHKDLLISGWLCWLYCLRLHPYSDGNGRLSRALAAVLQSKMFRDKRPRLISTLQYKMNGSGISQLISKADYFDVRDILFSKLTHMLLDEYRGS